MATKIRLTYFGMDGEGSTVSEAKKDAGARLESAMSGSYEPVIVQGAGDSILLYRDPRHGWVTKWIRDGKVGEGSSFSPGVDLKDAIRAARRHLAQNAIGVTPDNGMSIVDPRDRREHARYVGWQLAMKDAASRGEDVQADTTRRWADEHATEYAPAVA